MNRLRATAVTFLAFALALTLGSCGGEDPSGDATGGGSTSASPTPTPTDEMSTDASASPTEEAAHSDDDADQMVMIEIAGDTVTPEPGKTEVKLGSSVMLMITSDIADEVHVHGYDQEFELKPGETTNFTFTADIPGTFEVETHESGQVLTELEVK